MYCRNLTKTAAAILLLIISQLAMAQDKVVSGRVTDSKDGTGVPGVTVTPKGARTGTQTSSDGSYRITVGSNVTTLVFSSIGYATQEVDVAGRSSVDVSFVINNSQLGEVVVTGYGTARRKDITGSISTVKAKDFNKGVQPAPDQLIQGKIAGVQVINNSGAPGSGTTIRVRGTSSIRAGNTPLFVVDGVQLQNINTRPDVGFTDIGGGSPSGNPLNFINPADIASIDVLKDASAAAIYGSRGANGVVLITTRRGQSGAPKVEVNASVGVSSILKRLEVLSGDQYRQALGEFGFPTAVSTTSNPTANFGDNVDALESILQTGLSQNYGVAVSAGNESARYRLSFGYLDQEGIVRKTDFKKYSVGLNTNFKLLDNKKLSLDFNILTSQTLENVAPISNTAGFKGSLIGQALQWNPTKSQRKSDGSLNIEYGSDNINPLAFSEAYFDNPKVTTVLANFSPSYKITNDLEYKMQVSVTYNTGVRKTYTTAYININDIAIDGNGKGGEANVAQNELVTSQITHTLSYVKDLSEKVSLNAVAGYEYVKTKFSGNSSYARRFIPTDRPYYYFMASSDPTTRRTNGFANPTEELQSYFGRAIVNLSDKYIVTATVRADGSTKFGENNKYGVFPSFAAAWLIGKESFMSGMNSIKDLKLRLGWGITGNQEFPGGQSTITYGLTGGNPATFQQNTIANPDLKWEENQTFNVGLDFNLFGKINGSLDYFNRNTTNILFPREAADPVTPNSAVKWVNLPGELNNKGFEVTLNSNIIKNNDFALDLGVNATFLTNKITGFGALQIPTGEVSGQGLSGAFAQLLINDKPLNTFYLKKFIGIDKTTGISLYEGGEEKFFLGSANPETLLGVTINAAYKKLSLEINMNGAYGHLIYNNTANAVTSFNNLGKRNLGVAELELARSLGEKPVNPTSASSRYLEKGNYLKMANTTLSYNIGKIGKSIRGATVFITGQNLFIITDFTGFDPEVNVSKPLNGIPSFGMEYTPYPTARTFNFGINFSL
jgi:TonB-linked SusC/RagA family outer membrane protein